MASLSPLDRAPFLLVTRFPPTENEALTHLTRKMHTRELSGASLR